MATGDGSRPPPAEIRENDATRCLPFSHGVPVAAAPGVVDNLFSEMKTDLPRFVDLQGFGFVTGFASDWLALNLIFIPREPKKLFGFIPVHGVLHAQRDNVTRDYARILANDLFSADVLLDAILHGPTAERLFAAIEKEVSAALDAQAGFAQPLIRLAIGTKRYRQAKDAIVQMLLERLPETMQEAKDYTAKTLDIENLIVEKMTKLSPAQYEAILRPVFKDDEMLMVTVGAVLGFLVGELQVVLVEQFAR